MLIATSPGLAPDQVLTLLEQSAVDARPANGCFACTVGHDRFTGSGRLDQTAAIELLAAGAPPRDRYEPNDGAGAAPIRSSAPGVTSPRRSTTGTTGTTSTASISAPGSGSPRPPAATTGIKPSLSLWRPGSARDRPGVGSVAAHRRPPGRRGPELPGAGGRLVSPRRPARPRLARPVPARRHEDALAGQPGLRRRAARPRARRAARAPGCRRRRRAVARPSSPRRRRRRRRPRRSRSPGRGSRHRRSAHRAGSSGP